MRKLDKSNTTKEALEVFQKEEGQNNNIKGVRHERTSFNKNKKEKVRNLFIYF